MLHSPLRNSFFRRLKRSKVMPRYGWFVYYNDFIIKKHESKGLYTPSALWKNNMKFRIFWTQTCHVIVYRYFFLQNIRPHKAHYENNWVNIQPWWAGLDVSKQKNARNRSWLHPVPRRRQQWLEFDPGVEAVSQQHSYIFQDVSLSTCWQSWNHIWEGGGISISIYLRVTGKIILFFY